jgi:D-alanine-D-alanine ligase
MTNEYKKTVAVLFGGMSLEHDVSILTGLQIINSIDSSKYNVFPVYIDKEGIMWYGKELLDRKNYHFSQQTKDKLKQLTLNVGTNFSYRPYFIKKNDILPGGKKIFFDIAFLAFHGEVGENGYMQSLFEVARIPYVGPRAFDASIFMNKAISKAIFRDAGIKVLDDVVIKKPEIKGAIDVKKLLKDVKIKFPACVKPCNLGSSVGVSKAKNNTELQKAILEIFKIDNEVIIEPFVENLIEYNVAITRALENEIKLSVIELPFKKDALLSFKDKYLSSGGSKGTKLDNKLSGPPSAGMASLTREINPKLTAKQKKFIEENAIKAFESVNGTGAPRIDFLCNKKTGQIWFNEVNPIPGSLAFYLWEPRKPKVGFTQLLTGLIQEGFKEHGKSIVDKNLKTFNASIFPQKY